MIAKHKLARFRKERHFHMAKAMASEKATAKAAGLTDDQIAKLEAVPGFNWAALLALLAKLGSGGITIADILALFGL